MEPGARFAPQLQLGAVILAHGPTQGLTSQYDDPGASMLAVRTTLYIDDDLFRELNKRASRSSTRACCCRP